MSPAAAVFAVEKNTGLSCYAKPERKVSQGVTRVKASVFVESKREVCLSRVKARKNTAVCFCTATRQAAAKRSQATYKGEGAIVDLLYCQSFFYNKLIIDKHAIDCQSSVNEIDVHRHKQSYDDYIVNPIVIGCD